MENPLNSSQMLNNQNSSMQIIQNMASMLRSSKNPQQLMAMLAQKNPQVNSIMQMCEGKNPRDVFMAECKNRGIDPKEIMDTLGLK